MKTSNGANPAAECTPPFLSIVTPSYNYANYIGEAIQSVHQQGFRDFEHIVLDDGSTDDSLDRVQCLRLPIQIEKQTNQGLANTLNTLLRMARGTWVGWLNADDFYLRDSFANLHRAVSANPDADVIVGDTAFVDGSGRFQRLLPAHPITRRVIAHYGMSAATCAYFIRRSALSKVAIRPQSRILMDKWLFLDLLDSGARFAYLPFVFGAMRRHDGQLSARLHGSASAERTAFRLDANVPSSGLGLRLSRGFGILLHASLKAASGGYWRQFQARRQIGSDLRWWTEADAAETLTHATGNPVLRR